MKDKIFDYKGAGEWWRRASNMVWDVSEDYDTSIAKSKEGGFHSGYKRPKGRSTVYGFKKQASITDPEVIIKASEGKGKAGKTSKMSREDAELIALYGSAHEGAHLKDPKHGGTDFNVIAKGIATAKEYEYNKKNFKALLNVMEDARVDNTVIKKRPGFKDMRNDATRILRESFGDLPYDPSNPDFNVIAAVNDLMHGKDVHIKGMPEEERMKAVEMAAQLEKRLPHLNSTEDVVLDASKMYERYFQTELSEGGGEGDGDDEDEGEGGEDDERKDGKKKKSSMHTKGGDEEGESGESDGEDGDSGDGEGSEDGEGGDGDGGFSKDDLDKATPDADDLKDARDLKDESALESLIDEKTKDALKEAKDAVEKDESSARRAELEADARKEVERIDSGRLKLWTKERETEINQRLCVGVHAGAVVRYYQTEKTRIERGLNSMSAFDLKNLDASATQLASKIREAMRAAKDTNAYEGLSGKIQARKAYKPEITGDMRIFNKSEDIEEGGFVVDLVLDASGSQSSRVISIRRQTYIIAKAMVLAGIPCRVTQYNVEDVVSMIERLKDYDDTNVKDTLGFYAGSDNRDGLHLLTVYEDLKLRPEEHKIMIVLSDGSPWDCSGETIISAFGGEGRYTETFGTQDTAKIIRQLRKHIEVMGIYVGEGHRTLNFEKTMFGNDFAWIKDMNGFVPKVWDYLHKQIQNTIANRS